MRRKTVEIKCYVDGAAKIRRRRDWSVDDFDAMEIRHSSSTKFDGAGVYDQRQRGSRRRCWLGGRKGIRPVKRVVGVGVVVCLERGANLHMAELMPLPLAVSCSSKIQIGFAFLVPAYTGCPGKEAVKWL